MRAFACLVVLASILAASPTAAQRVQGVLVDGAGAPVAGAFMSLRDGGDAVVSRMLTGPDGRFQVQAPAAGTYRVRAERIGYAQTTSAALMLAAGETRDLRLVSAGAPVALEGIVAEARSRCDVRRADGRAAAQLWEEARKAIDATTWTAGALRFGFTEYERTTSAETERITAAKSDRRASTGRSVWRSRDAGELARVGYREARGGDVYFFAPDAALLLSDSFQDTHCFGVRQGAGATAGLVGLTFQPARRTARTDVSGVLWLDRRTAELRHLDFRYTNLPDAEDHPEVGGRVEFARLAGGAWIVRRWRLRMPVVTRETWNTSVGRGSRGVVTALHETGGYVQEVTSGAGERVFAVESGAVEGTVSDAVTEAPLAGARVSLVGTDRSATTDAQGRFRVAGLDEGRYTVTFTHPRTDSLRYTVPATDVAVRLGATTPVRLLSPSFATVIAAACTGDSLAPGAGVLAGTVRKGETEVPLAGANVIVSWNGSAGPGRGEVVSDTEGNYRFCGAPIGVPLLVRAAFEGRGGRPDTVTLASAAPVLRDVRTYVISASVTVGGVLVQATGTPRVAVAARVVDAASGDPIIGARVRLGEDNAPRTTDKRGVATARGVVQGTYRVEIEHPDYGTHTRWIAVGGSEHVDVTFQVARRER